MRLTISREDLIDVLGRGGIPISIDPALNSAFRGFGRLEYSKGRLVVQSQGPTVAAKAYVQVDDTDAEDGVICVSIERMSEMLKFFPKSDNVIVSHVVSENSPNGEVHLKAGKTTLKIPCVHEKLFPDMGQPDGENVLTTDTESILAIIKSVGAYAMPNDADGIRSNIVCRSSEDKIYGAATDGISLCYDFFASGNLDSVACLPMRITKGLKKFLRDGEVSIRSNGKTMFMSQKCAFIRTSVTPAMDNKFPNFLRLMEMEYHCGISVSAELFDSVIQASNKTNSEEAILQVIDDEVFLYALSPVSGMRYSGSVKGTNQKGDMEVGFSPFMLTKFIQNISSDTIDISFSVQTNSKGWPAHIRLTCGNYNLFVKARVAMVSDPVHE